MGVLVVILILVLVFFGIMSLQKRQRKEKETKEVEASSEEAVLKEVSEVSTEVPAALEEPAEETDEKVE
jgi:Na+-transporting methylmalonyl-CoA/oxaloacetate decarboxylase gamma subunit